MAVTQYLIKNGAVQSGYTFTNSSYSNPGTIAENSGDTIYGFTTNSDTGDYRQFTAGSGSVSNNRNSIYYLSSPTSLSLTGWQRLKVTWYADANSTTNHLRLFIWKSSNSSLIDGTSGTNYAYVTAPTSSGTSTITLTSTLISNCTKLSIVLRYISREMNGYIKDLWLERDNYTYTVSYANGGHGTAPASQTKTEGTNLTLRSFISAVTGTTANYTITANKNGYTWSGSNGSATRTPKYTQSSWKATNGTTYSSGGTYSTDAETTMTAQWSTSYTYTYTLPTGTPTHSTTANSYTVAYNANGGTSTPSTQTSTKTTAYSFDGWYTAASGGTKRTTSSQVSASETVYAHMTAGNTTQNSVNLASAISKNNTTENGYTVTFNPNTGTTTKANETATRTLSWSFNKWAKDSASGTQYTAGTAFQPSANTTMYATWNSTVVSQGSVILPIETECTKDGYNLIGWATSDSATTPDYQPGDIYNPTGNITLYAVWEIAIVPVGIWIYKDNAWELCYQYLYNGEDWQVSVPSIYNNNTWTETSVN